MMRKNKLTKRERKAQREAAQRRRFYESTVVRCFLCGTWQLIDPPASEVWDCCCGAGGTVNVSETMQVADFLVDEWTDRVVQFWTTGEVERLGIDPGGAAELRRSGNPGLLFSATAQIWEHLGEGCECWTDADRAITTEIPDLQRVDWHAVSDRVRLRQRTGRSGR